MWRLSSAGQQPMPRHSRAAVGRLYSSSLLLCRRPPPLHRRALTTAAAGLSSSSSSTLTPSEVPSPICSRRLRPLPLLSVVPLRRFSSPAATPVSSPAREPAASKGRGRPRKSPQSQAPAASHHEQPPAVAAAPTPSSSSGRPAAVTAAASVPAEKSTQSSSLDAAPTPPIPSLAALSASPTQLPVQDEEAEAASSASTASLLVAFTPPSSSSSSSSSSSYSSLPSHLSTYVSHHYHIDRDEVYAYLRRKQLPFRLSADRSQLVIRDCPFCHPIGGKPDNQYKLTVYFPAANHHCHRCRARGSWYDLKRRLGDIRQLVVSTLREQPLQPNYTKGFPAFKRADGSAAAAEADGGSVGSRRPRQPSQASLLQYRQQLDAFPAIVHWLTAGAAEGGRGLRRDLLDLYHVGAGAFRFLGDDGKMVEEDCVTFPWMRSRDDGSRSRKRAAKQPAVSAAEADADREPEEEKEAEDGPAASASGSAPSAAAAASSAGGGFIVDRIKYRSRQWKHHQRLLPAGGNWGFFGFHTVPASASSVILTEGEFDAIAAYQCTGVPAISLPNGANSLPVELLPYLERFSRIFLWMDDDRVGQEGAETFAKKLGINRCAIVRTRGGAQDGPKDANDALLQGHDLCAILAAARPLPHEQITTFTQLRDEVWKEIADPQQRAGVQSTSLPTLNSLLKGHRRGELTVITGSTGVGKCFAAGTRLRLYSGDAVSVEDVRGGELLMGDDSTPRIVTPTSLTRGRAALHRISPAWAGAAAFTVNGDHILVLTNNCAPAVQQESSSSWATVWYELDTASNAMQRRMRRFQSMQSAAAEVIKLMADWRPLEWEVSVDDFLAAPADVRAACQLLQSAAVTFASSLPSLEQTLSSMLGCPASPAQLDWAAWYLGFCLTVDADDDDAISHAAPQQPRSLPAAVSRRLREYESLFGQPLQQPFDVSFLPSSADNIATRLQRAYGLQASRRLPQACICDSLHVRRLLLAVIIDGCGSCEQDSDGVELRTQHRDLAAEYRLLAASLGIRNSDIQPEAGKGDHAATQRSGHSLLLSGDMRDVLRHCQLPQLQQHRHQQQWPAAGSAAWLVKSQESRSYSFSIEPAGNGDYYGFAVTGTNRRFLLEDFTVTHNTTVLSQLSLDLCCQGVTTLWGSFEIRNFKLARTMLGQYSGVDLMLQSRLFSHYADQFEQLPMYFMTFFGSSSVEQVLDAMDYAVYCYDVQHVVLDNLQFMLSGQQLASSSPHHGLDKFDLQDRAVTEFRHFATHRNVHITLVIHPRKEADLRPLGVSSVFGSAKATQEADNVIILQAPSSPAVLSAATLGSDSSGWLRQRAEQQPEVEKFRRLQIMKNRYDGEVGSIPFLYDRATGRIQEVDRDGSVKHRAAFAGVVPAPLLLPELPEPAAAAAPSKKRAVKARAAASGGAVHEGGEAAFRPAPPFSPPAPLLSSSPPPHLVPSALPPPGPFHSSPVAVLPVTQDDEDGGGGQREKRRGAAEAGRRQQQQLADSVIAGRRYGRGDGDPHLSNPPFEFIA